MPNGLPRVAWATVSQFIDDFSHGAHERRLRELGRHDGKYPARPQYSRYLRRSEFRIDEVKRVGDQYEIEVRRSEGECLGSGV